MKRYSTCADRQEIVALYQQGCTYRQIVQQTHWQYETVRKICRAFKRRGEIALQGVHLGRPARGALSSFDPRVRFACLKIKRQHPGWGPDVVGAELRKRPWAVTVPLPGPSQIGVYFSQFGDRLIQPRLHKQLPQAQPLEAALRVVHGCWQIDAKERMHLPGFGLAHLWEVVDYASGIKIGAFVFPARQNGHACKVSWPQIRAALRQAFTRWGLPDRIRTDRDRVIVPEGDYPFPSAFTLWLAGLGIEHELIRRVIQNGSVERSHRTNYNRLAGYGPYEDLPDWQALMDYETWRSNAILPSRGRACRRKPPLTVYPQARTPRRFYRFEDELQSFDPQRVEAYLAQGKWLRHTSQKGQFSFNNQKFNLGVLYKQRWVQIRYSPEVGFQVTCPPDKEVLKILEVNGLTATHVTGMAIESV